MGDDNWNQDPRAQEQDAARALIAGIEAYEREARLLRGGWDAEAYGRAWQQFGQLRDLALRLHLLQGEWVAVLISRFEFTDLLWKRRGEAGVGERLHEVHEVHVAALRKLRQACEKAYGLRRD